jgi:hypothetical protein
VYPGFGVESMEWLIDGDRQSFRSSSSIGEHGRRGVGGWTNGAGRSRSGIACADFLMPLPVRLLALAGAVRCRLALPAAFHVDSGLRCCFVAAGTLSRGRACVGHNVGHSGRRVIGVEFCSGGSRKKGNSDVGSFSNLVTFQLPSKGGLRY